MTDTERERMIVVQLDDEEHIKRVITNLVRGVDYAIRIIESYELDMRNTDVAGHTLAEHGVCQGEIYRDAITRIIEIVNSDASLSYAQYRLALDSLLAAAEAMVARKEPA